MINVRFSVFHTVLAVCTATLIVASPLVLAATSATPTPVSTEPADTTATYGNWVLHCVRLSSSVQGKNNKAGEDKDSCEIVQSAQVQGQPRPVMEMAIGRLPGQKAYRVTTVLPTNVSIPGRVHVSIDGKANGKEKAGFDLALTRCLPGGCVAVTTLDNNMRKQMGAGKTGQLRFISADGQKIGIPVSWMGFSQAMKALEKKD
ncbi:invasion associated locus B family protein [Marinomonas spartinae]|uniref:invasion associated locus B family protein n=1 Tax=Marinomonas spartinae TaxID=1792290 RepID=UPI001F37DB84|nr:invasion associated locus B family protein [Marinomonas spartinae]